MKSIYHTGELVIDGSCTHQCTYLKDKKKTKQGKVCSRQPCHTHTATHNNLYIHVTDARRELWSHPTASSMHCVTDAQQLLDYVQQCVLAIMCDTGPRIQCCPDFSNKIVLNRLQLLFFAFFTKNIEIVKLIFI